MYLKKAVFFFTPTYSYCFNECKKGRSKGKERKEGGRKKEKGKGGREKERMKGKKSSLAFSEFSFS